MEFYYKQKNSYLSLPPYRQDCLASLENEKTAMELIYPRPHPRIYVPVEIVGKAGATIFKAALRTSGIKILWHTQAPVAGSTV